MKPLRIAIFLSSFPVVSETFILRQITGLLDMGYEVDIFADTRGDMDSVALSEASTHKLLDRTTFMDMPPEAAPWEMPVWPITGRTWIPGSEKSSLNLLRFARALPKFVKCFCLAPQIPPELLKRSEYGYRAASLSSLYRFAKLSGISPHRYSVLHAHFGPTANSFRFARALWHARLVVTFHGHDFSAIPRTEGRDVYKQLFQDADTVTVNCDYARERVRELGCPPERIQKLHMGVDLKEFAFQEHPRVASEPVRVLTVARLVEKKGIEFAIRAVAIAREKHAVIRYDIIGDGPLRSWLEKLITDLRVNDIVTLHGAARNQAVRERMKEAHIFLLPSVTAQNGDQEGTPVSLIEAQACGLPVISTRHSGIPEVVLDNESGYLVAERDTNALAEKLSILVENPRLCSQFGACGRKHVEAQFDVHQLNKELVRIYDQTVCSSAAQS